MEVPISYFILVTLLSFVWFAPILGGLMGWVYIKLNIRQSDPELFCVLVWLAGTVFFVLSQPIFYSLAGFAWGWNYTAFLCVLAVIGTATVPDVYNNAASDFKDRVREAEREARQRIRDQWNPDKIVDEVMRNLANMRNEPARDLPRERRRIVLKKEKG